MGLSQGAIALAILSTSAVLTCLKFRTGGWMGGMCICLDLFYGICNELRTRGLGALFR